MTGREQFERYYADKQLPCLSSVKERHWQTWMEAQAALLAAHGPVTMMYFNEVGQQVAVMPGVRKDASE